MEWSGLRGDDGLGINLWVDALIKRFHPHRSVALAALTFEKYTVQDARNRRETADYLQAILRHAKGAGIESEYNQLTFAWNGLDPELRVFIQQPTGTPLPRNSWKRWK